MDDFNFYRLIFYFSLFGSLCLGTKGFLTGYIVSYYSGSITELACVCKLDYLAVVCYLELMVDVRYDLVLYPDEVTWLLGMLYVFFTSLWMLELMLTGLLSTVLLKLKLCLLL